MSWRPASAPRPVHRRWGWDLDKAALLLRQLRVASTGEPETAHEDAKRDDEHLVDVQGQHRERN